MAHDDRLAVALRRQRHGSGLDGRDATIERLETELHTTRASLRTKLEGLAGAGEPLGDELGDSRAEQSALHAELKLVNAELDHAREELGRAHSDHAEYLALLSHELRNPLMLIGCGLEVLEHGEPGGTHARRALATLRRQFGHLSRLIDDLLDVTRVGRGKIQLRRERLDLGELVRRTVVDHRDRFGGAGIALELAAVPRPLAMDGDPTRLRQVLGNLLHNAAKFTPRGGAVIVSAVEDAASTRAILRVQDTGVGIDPATLPRVFEPFLQADAALELSGGGLGLGLAIVKGVVEAHGGTAAAASDGPGRGATFTISLPLAAG